MEKTEKIWMDGKFVDWDDAKVHVLAHALNYGTGVFEGIRVYETSKGLAVFRLKDHVKRLMGGCKVMCFKLDYTYEEIFDAIKETVRVNRKVDYVKPCVFLCGEAVGLNPIGVPVKFTITSVHLGSYLGKDAQEKGASLITSSWFRPWNLAAPAGAKVNGVYVTSCLAKMEAKHRGADEAVMLNAQGNVAECSGENIFILKRGKLYTSQPSESILEGITRNSIIDIARDLGYDVIETNISRIDLYTADEVFMTGTAAEVTQVTKIDERPIGDGKPGKVGKQLAEKFAEVVRGKDPKYEKWLDRI
ncbi:MAG: branched-chain amino acid transaminase [Methanomassiliicoccaceae archaeon]|jgi:branched-chain amino acid aminotransferase|nr:branched-chain amino acid transaminase [Methanomassiliicoccaceae archaeon]